MGPTTRLMKLEHSFRPLATFFFRAFGNLFFRTTHESYVRERERERDDITLPLHILEIGALIYHRI
jgi:hypothetical protein